MRVRYYAKLWYGLIAYLASLGGTVLLTNELDRPWAVLLLISAAVLAVILWGRQEWTPAFPRYPVTRVTFFKRSSFIHWFGLPSAFLVALAGDLRYLAVPKETFGLAGLLWLVSIGFLLWSSFVWSQSTPDYTNELHLSRWTAWEMVIFAGLVLVALLARIWNLTGFPDNIYPDEVMTGTVATQPYINPTGRSPSVFSTLWSGIELPALWFWIVGWFLKVGGSSLAMLRLPAALFGAATAVPLYGLIRGTWGRYAAIGGTAIMAFSASNIHFSRLALNNITTQFFWTVCFFFLLRGLRSRRPFDWIFAGLSAGLSEYFYYGTRLLPFILILYVT